MLSGEVGVTTRDCRTVILANGARSLVLAGLVTLGMFMPFLPGRYDSLAPAVSLMAQVVGTAGLLVAAIGALWAITEYRRSQSRVRNTCAVVTMLTSLLVWVLISFAALTAGVIFGAWVLAAGGFAIWRLFVAVRRRLGDRPERWSVVPINLVLVPPLVLLAQLALGGRATDGSRTRAIQNAAPLIADIERYRVANGRYPSAVLSVWPDYAPSVIGIREYRYEPAGESYNLMFENPTLRVGTREIVVYNPRDEQAIASHALDVLQLTPGQLALERTRGHYGVHSAPHQHWKYFWFD